MKEFSCQISREQSTALKILVFLLTILVVLRHSMNLHLFYESGNAWLPVADANIAVQRFCTEFTHAAVPGFFFISGVLFFQNLENIRTIGAKLQRRVKSLLVPYFFWNVVSLAFWTGISLIPALHPQMVKTFGMEHSLGWSLSRLTIHPIVGQFWYIRTLILFVCLSPLVFLSLKSRYLSLSVLYCLFLFWQPIDTRVLSTEGAVFFYLGAYFATYGGLPRRLSVKRWFWLVPVCVVLILQSIFHWLPFSVPFGVNLGVTLLLLWEVCLCMASFPKTEAFLQKLGQHSFFIYALHGSLISGLSVLIAKYVPHTACISASVFWGCFLTTLLLSLGISWLVKRCFPKLHSVFSGGR